MLPHILNPYKSPLYMNIREKLQELLVKRNHNPHKAESVAHYLSDAIHVQASIEGKYIGVSNHDITVLINTLVEFRDELG